MKVARCAVKTPVQTAVLLCCWTFSTHGKSTILYSGQVALKLMREPSSPEEVKASFLFQQGNQLKMAKLSKTHTFFQPSFVYFKWCQVNLSQPSVNHIKCTHATSSVKIPPPIVHLNHLRPSSHAGSTLLFRSCGGALKAAKSFWRNILTSWDFMTSWPALRFGHEHGMKVMKMYRARRPGVSWILGNSSNNSLVFYESCCLFCTSLSFIWFWYFLEFFEHPVMRNTMHLKLRCLMSNRPWSSSPCSRLVAFVMSQRQSMVIWVISVCRMSLNAQLKWFIFILSITVLIFHTFERRSWHCRVCAFGQFN